VNMRFGWAVLAAGVAAGCIGYGPVLAAEAPHAEDSSQTLRDFSLRNETDQTIVEAHAYTTKGKDIAVTKAGPIRPRLSENFMFQQAECLDRIEIKFANGKTMSRDKLNDCSVPRLVARNDGITVETGAGGPVNPATVDKASRNPPGK